MVEGELAAGRSSVEEEGSEDGGSGANVKGGLRRRREVESHVERTDEDRRENSARNCHRSLRTETGSEPGRPVTLDRFTYLSAAVFTV